MWYQCFFYCCVPITNAQSKHPIDHPRSIFQLLVLSKVACNIVLQASCSETSVGPTRPSMFVCFDCKGPKMSAGSIQYRQCPSFQYTAAVSLDHGIRDILPCLVDFRPVRPRGCVLGRKYRSNSIPVRRVDLRPTAYFRIWVLYRSIGGFREAVTDVSADRGSIGITINGIQAVQIARRCDGRYCSC